MFSRVANINRIIHEECLTKYQILGLSCLMANSVHLQDPIVLNSGIFLPTFTSSLKDSTVWHKNELHQKLQVNKIHHISKIIACGNNMVNNVYQTWTWRNKNKNESEENRKKDWKRKTKIEVKFKDSPTSKLGIV